MGVTNFEGRDNMLQRKKTKTVQIRVISRETSSSNHLKDEKELIEDEKDGNRKSLLNIYVDQNITIYS